MTAKDTCEPTSNGDTCAPQAEQHHPSSESIQATSDTTLPPPPRSSKTKRKKKKKQGAASASQCRQSSAEVCLYAGLDTFKVTTNPVLGRCVVASRDLREGELVLDEPPFAKVLRRDCGLRHCAACCQPVQRDAEIQTDVFTVYCTEKCKSTENALRSSELGVCSNLADVSIATDVDLDLLRMMVRLVIMRAKALGLQQDGSRDVINGEGVFLLQQWRNLHSLMHHREDMSPSWINVVRAAATRVMPMLPEWAQCDVEEMVELACRVNVNAHGLRDDSGSNCIIGVGVFPLTAMINHSCRPNCTFAYHGGKLAVRAMQPVPTGTELTLYYIDLLQSTAERRRELLTSKHFWCGCYRCETPEPGDANLDGVCCSDCGRDGCLTPIPPPNPEEAVTAQLALLGEDVVDSSAGKQVRGRSKKNQNGRRSSGADAGKSPFAGSGQISAGSVTPDPGNKEGVNSIEVGNVLFCPSCGRDYQASVVEEAVARAKAARDAAMAVLRVKDFLAARKMLEKWLQDYDAGSATPLAASSRKPVRRGSLKLHPMHATVVQTLVPLANCCNFEGDYSTSAEYLRRAISAMEAIYPPNFPELGDFHAALAEALASFLEKRGQTLPRRIRDQAVSERKTSLSRAVAIRSVCLGEHHPTAEEARRALALTCSVL